MKVLLVSNLYGALARGGAERVVAEEAASLRSLGHDVVVVSGVPGEAGEKRKEESGHADGIRHITYAPPNVAFYTDLVKHGAVFKLWWHYLDTFNAGSAARFVKIVRAEKPDVVHTHNLMGLGFMIPSALRRLRKRHVHTVHDVQLLDPSGLLPADRPFKPAPHQALYIAVMRAVMGSPEVVIFPSNFHQRLHERFGFFPKSRCVVVRNPSPTHSGDSPQNGLFVDKSSRRFLFAGQLEKHKGIFDLLDAWEKADLKDATLEIAGSGSQAVAVAERVAKMRGAKMLGRLDGTALDAAYARASWLVLPSRVIENAPASIMEALGRGVPVIASVSGGIPEVVRDGENGFLFPPGDSALLASVLEKAAELDTSAHDRMSAAAQTSLAGRNTESHARSLVSLYGSPVKAP